MEGVVGQILLLDFELEVPDVSQVLLEVANFECFASQEVSSNLRGRISTTTVILIAVLNLHLQAELLVKLAQRPPARLRICSCMRGLGHLSIVQAIETIIVGLPVLLTPLWVVDAASALLIEAQNNFGSLHICVELSALFKELLEGLISASIIVEVMLLGPRPWLILLLLI